MWIFSNIIIMTFVIVLVTTLCSDVIAFRSSSSSSSSLRLFLSQNFQRHQQQHQHYGSSSSSSLLTTRIPRTTSYYPSTFIQTQRPIISKTTKISLSTSSTSITSSIIGTPETSFDDGKCPFEITTPIYYVNDKPHIGHAYTSVACDVIARFMRLSGREVFFLSGTDEHGQKVEQSAAAKGMNPKDFVDLVSVNFRDMLSLLNISNDDFIRTTNVEHKIAVQHLWNTLTDNGYIYLDTYSGWYSIRDECFYSESELIDGKAPTGAAVEWVAKEKSYFFKLSLFQDQLLQYYEDHPEFIAPDGRRNEVISFVKGGLRDLSISRTSFQWGIQVPNDNEHIMYVWIDALMNYISALGYPNQSTDSNYQKFWPASLHIVGKDILRFHAVYWPAFLMAANIPLPKRLFAHGWWTKDGQKISKSVGNVIDPFDLVNKYGVDQTRFFLMSEVNFGNDGDYSDKAMVLKINSNLANELGNLCQRTLTLVYKNCNAMVPEVVGLYTNEDEIILKSAQSLREKAAIAISKQLIHKYVEIMITMIVDANKYIDEQAPWILKKTDSERMGTVLYVIMEILRYSAIIYQPLIPESANKMLDLLTVPSNERSFIHLNDTYRIKSGSLIDKPVGIFPRFEVQETEELVKG